MKFVQIGAHIGNDDAYKIIKEHKVEFGLLVEPLPHLIPKLKEAYKDIPNVFIENKAISLNSINNITFFYDDNDPITELSSLNKQHLIDHKVKEEHIKEIIISAETLESLLDKHNVVELDYLFIDTEGLDCDILQAFDLKKYKIKNIIFEDIHSDGSFTRGLKYKSVVNKMKSEGYKVEKISNNNTQCHLHENLNIIYRISDSGYNKVKPPYINNKACLLNALKQFPTHKFNWILIADNVGEDTRFFIEQHINIENIHYVNMGSGAKTFNYGLDLALKNFKDNDIVYFLENDYLHKEGSYQALIDGFQLNPSFMSLYDHPDKYIDPSLGGNKHCGGGAEDTRVYLTGTSHWKITNSTTMTFASRILILKQAEAILRKWTTDNHPHDYEMFMELQENNFLLITPIPSYSTHGETQWLAPLINWETI